MRLATLILAGREQACVDVPGRGYVPIAELGLGLPDDLLGILEVGLTDELIARLGQASSRVPDTMVVAATDARLAPPYRRPRKLWGIGLNYRAHADDLKAPYPSEPASFVKGDHTIIGPGDEIRLPEQSQRVTAEGELGLIIGRLAWQVDESDALDHVGAVCCILDQTAEDILERNPRFLTRSKNFPTFFSFGPQLVTTDEVRDTEVGLGDLLVGTWRNGALHRENLVENMVFSLAELVSFHSRVMPLYPGDIISTGTPGAVVIGDGDFVECRIDRVGRLQNRVRAGIGLSSAGGDD